MNNFNLFSNISINKKLGILFITVAMGFLAIALTYWYMLDKQKKSTEHTNLFIEYGQLTSSAQKNYFKVRRFEKDFLLSISTSTGQTYNNLPLQEHAKHIELLESDMAKLRELSNKIDSTAAAEILVGDVSLPENYISNLVTQASTVVDDYKSSFSEIVKFNSVVGLTTNEGLRKKANDLLQNIEDRVKNTNNPRLFTLLANMRAQEEHILQSVDLTESYENIKNMQSNFHNQLQTTNLDTKTRLAASNLSELYLNVVDEIVTNKRNANEYTELYDFMLGPMFDEMGQSSQLRIEQNQSAQQDVSNFVTTLASLALLVIAGLVSLLLYLFADSLRKPITSLLDTIHNVNDGDLDARVNSTRKDELGELSTSFDKLLDEKVAQLSASEKENEILNDSVIGLIQAVAQLSRKDFTIKVPVAEDVTGAVGDSLNLLTKETSNTLNDVKKISRHVAGLSNLIQKQSSSVMEVAKQERMQVENTVRELNKSSDTMNKISSDAADANKRASFALKNTESALQAVNRSVDGINSIRDTIRETEKRIKRLGERSQEITGIVNLINSIAERTHILALNASMHAASAGEAGRGFAVVADEVQRLAESAREATTEISTLINNIRVETTDTVTAMNQAITNVAEGTQLAELAGTAMLRTQESTEDLVKAVEVITNKSKEQAQSSLDLVEKSRNIVASTHETDKHLRQQTNNTINLVKNSKRLLSTVSVFKLPETEEEKAQNRVNNTAVKELENVIDNEAEAPISSTTSSSVKVVNA